MGTNIVIDDKLMRGALRVTGLKTKREILEPRPRTILRFHKQDFDPCVKLLGMDVVG
jgi:Arc/MetJ family transcription regulator